jgi:hypothetical protein
MIPTCASTRCVETSVLYHESQHTSTAVTILFKHNGNFCQLYKPTVINSITVVPHVFHIPKTKLCDRLVNPPALYSGGPRFKSWVRDWLS